MELQEPRVGSAKGGVAYRWRAVEAGVIVQVGCGGGRQPPRSGWGSAVRGRRKAVEAANRTGMNHQHLFTFL